MRREFQAKRKFIGDKLGSRSVRGPGEIASFATQCVTGSADHIDDEEEEEKGMRGRR